MPVVITGNNTPTAGGVTYGDGTTYANTAAGSSGEVLLSNGASAPTWGTAGTSTTATNLAGGSNGTIPYQSAAGTTQMLAVGSAGQVLQTNGAGAPTWVTPVSGSWVYLSTVTASASATVDIETTFNSTYQNYALVVSNLRGSTNAVFLQCRFKLSTYITSADYFYNLTRVESGSTGYLASIGSAATAINLAYEVSNTTTNSAQFTMYIHNPSSTSSFKSIYSVGANSDTTKITASNAIGFCDTDSTTPLTGLRFFMASGNITAGTFRLYGIKNS